MGSAPRERFLKLGNEKATRGLIILVARKGSTIPEVTKKVLSELSKIGTSLSDVSDKIEAQAPPPKGGKNGLRLGKRDESQS